MSLFVWFGRSVLSKILKLFQCPLHFKFNNRCKQKLDHEKDQLLASFYPHEITIPVMDFFLRRASVL